jgi:hypothetical protein
MLKIKEEEIRCGSSMDIYYFRYLLGKAISGKKNIILDRGSLIWWAIRTKPPTPKIRLIKISPYQNIALFDHPTANHPKSGGSVYEGSAYAGSVYGGSAYGGSARRSARCPARCSARRSALKTLRTEAPGKGALRTKALRMETLYTEALHNALH